MVAQTAKIATDNAKRYTSNQPGQCLKYTRTWLEIASYYGDAATAWRNAKKKHTDRNPPAGAPVLWTGGRNGYGHAALSLGNGKIRTTDATKSGQTSTQDLSWPEKAWGLKYAGWTEDLNNVTIPYLSGGSGSQGDDDMPHYTRLKLAAPQAVSNSYKYLKWTASSDPGGKFSGNVSLNIPTSPYSQTLSIVVDGPAGMWIYARTVEATKQGDDYVIAETGHVEKVQATSATTVVNLTTNQKVGKGNRLRWQVMTSQKATVSGADAVVLWWD